MMLNDLKHLISLENTTLIVGDFNACYRENSTNKLINGLVSLGFQQLVHHPTHIKGRIIDHAYILDPLRKLTTVIERYSPYYSDHDAICISISNF